jgi:outer membrane lipoprotein carrier protein
MCRLFLRYSSSLVLASVFVGYGAQSDAGPSVKALVSLFEARYRAAHTLRAAFLERYIENGHVVHVEAGTAYFRRPGKMRWEYESPEKNLFLVDGRTAWFYVPADHTVTRAPARQSTDWRTPLALLAGEMKVSRVCSRIGPALNEKPESPDDVVLSCELRGSSTAPPNGSSPETSAQKAGSGEAVFLEIAKMSGDLVRVLVRDPGGVGIEFHFANWQADPQVADSLFVFTPPAGVAIVNGDLPAANAIINP